MGSYIFSGCGRTSRLGLSAINRWGRGFYTVRVGVDPGDRRNRPLLVGVVDIGMEKFLKWGLDPIIPACGGTSMAVCVGIIMFSTNLPEKSERCLAVI